MTTTLNSLEARREVALMRALDRDSRLTAEENSAVVLAGFEHFDQRNANN